MRSFSDAAARLADVPLALAAKLRTWHYRRAFECARSFRVAGHGRILNPGGNRGAVRIGNHSILRGELFVFPHSGRIALGDWVFLGENSRIWSSNQVVVGDRVLISHDVNIHDTNGHPIDAIARFEQTQAIILSGHPNDITTIASAPVTIGDDAWIGFGATVLKGVTIGAGAIIAARSLVTKNVAAGTMVAGNPARLMRDVSV